MQVTTLFTTALFFGNVLISAAQFSPSLAKTYGGPGNDGIQKIKASPDGGFLMAGTSGETGGDVTENGGCSDMWLIKTDAEGNLQWQKSIAISSCDHANDFIQTADGGVVVLGTRTSAGLARLHAIKLDNELEIEWQYSFGSADTNSFGHRIAEIPSGGFFVTGMQHDGQGTIMSFVFKLTAEGESVWEHSEVSGGGTTHILPCPDGNFLVTYLVEFSPVNMAPQIMKIDADGNVLWTEIIFEMYWHLIKSLAPTSDGGFITASEDLADFGFSFLLYLTKFDSDGNIEWMQSNEGASLNEGITFLKEMQNGNYLGAGFSHLSTVESIYMFQADSAGNIILDDYFGGSGWDQANSGVFVDNQLYLAGLTNSTDGDFGPGNGGNEAFFMKFDVTLSAFDHELSQLKIWPNPVSSILNIDIAVENAEIIIVDMTGKVVLEETRPMLNVAHLASGIYTVKVIAANEVRAGKFIKK